jgi:hypothetical protein
VKAVSEALRTVARASASGKAELEDGLWSKPNRLLWPAWADSARRELTWGTTGVCAKATIPLLVRVFSAGARAEDVYIPLICKGFQHQFWQPVKAAARRTYEWHHLAPARMLIALPPTTVRVTTDVAACNSISILARRVSGRVSVGLNAKLVVKATNK